MPGPVASLGNGTTPPPFQPRAAGPRDVLPRWEQQEVAVPLVGGREGWAAVILETGRGDLCSEVIKVA